ncbi:hypothetical protein [Halomarina oriensis]|uniref:Uncharacterized protein n=1 Tax=Halomarina oriensis TaxID=671145 RepID=A0A6B0GUU9_9EURY|nr:hypothetical protein [Halomarina oriensis]MWG35915.1 hypothetical protein [Halomarina oriensis]
MSRPDKLSTSTPHELPEDLPESITVDVSMDEALCGDDPEDHDDEFVEKFVNWEAEIQTSSALNDLASSYVDEDDVGQATCLLWVDQAEVYPVCDGHYLAKKDGQWSGFTTHPNYHQLRERMERSVEEGRHCSFCYRERVKALRERIEDVVDVEVDVQR